MAGVASEAPHPGAVDVKICGLTRPADVAAAVACGASMLGFVFFPPSPRNLSPETAADLARGVPPGVLRVALTVDADDAALSRILGSVPIEMLQLHGHEPPERVAALRARFGLPVMKAVGVAGPRDTAQIDRFDGVADRVLVDARPPRGAALPGGNGVAFDWRLIAGRRWAGPWMLAGGLTPETVAEAIRLTGAPGVDVSSGVEAAAGVKDAARIRAFVTAAKRAR